MKIKKATGIGIVVLATVLALWQLGCKTSETPPASESASEPGAGTAPGTGAAPGTKPAATGTKPAAPAGKSAPARTATLAAGTPLKVRTTTAVSTNSHKAGDTFVATLEEPLAEGNWTIAPKGATVEGRVVEADKGGRVKGVAHLTIELTSLTTADGRTVEIATKPITVQARTTKKKDAAKIGVGSGIGAAVGAIAGGGKGAAIGAAAGAGAGTGVVLSTRGDAAGIGSETVLHFELRSPVTLTGRS